MESTEMMTLPSNHDRRAAEPPRRDRVHMVLVTVLSLLTAAVTGVTALRFFEQDAIIETAALISMAHADARALALQTRVPTYLHIDPDAGMVWVEIAGNGFARQVEAQGVKLESDRRLLCFDAGAKPLVGGACEAHFGAISLRALTGEAVFHINAQGRLHRL